MLAQDLISVDHCVFRIVGKRKKKVLDSLANILKSFKSPTQVSSVSPGFLCIFITLFVNIMHT